MRLLELGGDADIDGYVHLFGWLVIAVMQSDMPNDLLQVIS